MTFDIANSNTPSVHRTKVSMCQHWSQCLEETLIILSYSNTCRLTTPICSNKCKYYDDNFSSYLGFSFKEINLNKRKRISQGKKMSLAFIYFWAKPNDVIINWSQTKRWIHHSSMLKLPLTAPHGKSLEADVTFWTAVLLSFRTVTAWATAMN